jgi:hypothetical protein
MSCQYGMPVYLELLILKFLWYSAFFLLFFQPKTRWLLSRGSQKYIQCYFGQSPNDVVGDMRPDEDAVMECRHILDSSKEGIAWTSIVSFKALTLSVWLFSR